MKSEAISPEKVRLLLRYEPSTGHLYWRERTAEFFAGGRKRNAESMSRWWNNYYAGKRTFASVNAHGYHNGHILDHPCYAHRVVWAIVHGVWPTGEIDHINGDPLDNRICNLRQATRAQNESNKGIQRNNTSGVKGVCWNKSRSKWVAQITVNGKHKRLGQFACIDEAAAAYAHAANEAFEGFARTARKEQQP